MNEKAEKKFRLEFDDIDSFSKFLDIVSRVRNEGGFGTEISKLNDSTAILKESVFKAESVNEAAKIQENE